MQIDALGAIELRERSTMAGLRIERSMTLKLHPKHKMTKEEYKNSEAPH
jgi:hypothetical protein